MLGDENKGHGINDLHQQVTAVLLYLVKALDVLEKIVEFFLLRLVSLPRLLIHSFYSRS